MLTHFCPEFQNGYSDWGIRRQGGWLFLVFRLSGTVVLNPERQSARKSWTENDRLSSLASNPWISVAFLEHWANTKLKRVKKGSHSFTWHSHVYSWTEWASLAPPTQGLSLFLCMLNHCLEWYKWVLTNLDHDRRWFNTLIRPSHESPVVYFVCRSFSLLQVQGCQTVCGSRLFVAERLS